MNLRESVFLIVYWFLLVSIRPVTSEKNEIIWLGSLFPSEGWTGGIDCYPAVQIAVDDINADNSILPNHRLELMMNDSRGNPQLAVKSILGQITEHPVAGIIGAGCSIESAPTALVCAFYHLPQISYSSTSPELSNKGLYPYFTRVVSSDAFQARAWIAILKFYRWTRIATLNSQESLHSLHMSTFISLTKNLDGIDILASESFPGSSHADTELQLNNIRNSGATIIFMACYEADAAIILKTAAKLGMIGPYYAWIGTDSWVDPTIYSLLNNSVDYLLGMIGTHMESGSSNATRRFHEKYMNKTLKARNSYTYYVESAYDSVWLMAKALHQVIEIDEISYAPQSPLFNKRVLDTMYKINFTGVSAGIVSLTKEGDRMVRYRVFNFVKMIVDGKLQVARVPVASWDPLTDKFIEFKKVQWSDGSTTVPRDYLIRNQYFMSTITQYTFVVLSVIGILGCAALLLFLTQRSETTIRSDQTALFSYIILIASMLFYSVIVVLQIQPVSSLTCLLPHWIGHIALILILGSLSAKSYSIWQELKKISFTLPCLIAFTLLCVIFLTLFSILDPLEPRTRTDDTDTTLFYVECSSNNLQITLWTLFVAELVFLLLSAFLSFMAKKKSNSPESKRIAIIIASFFIIGFCFVPPSLYFRGQQTPDVTFIINASGIFISTSLLVGLLFVTPLLYQSRVIIPVHGYGPDDHEVGVDS